MRTPDKIMQDVGIDIEQLKNDKPMLYSNIRRAMDEFAEQYAEFKISKNNTKTNAKKNIESPISCCMSCKYWRKLRKGKGECMNFSGNIRTDEGFFCKDFSEGDWETYSR